MRLTQQNAAQFVGKSLFGGRFHYWPLRVIQHKNGLYYYIDRFGVMMKCPDQNDLFNAVYFSRAE